MSTNDKCILCGQQCLTKFMFERDVTHYDCISCGQFYVTSEAKSYYLIRMSQDLKQRIAACTRERNIRGLPKLWLYSNELKDNAPDGAYTIDYILNNLFPSRIQDRLDRVLSNFCRLTSVPGEAVRLQIENQLPVFFAESTNVAHFTLKELQEQKYISASYVPEAQAPPPWDIVVRAAGISRIQQLEQAEGREQSKQAFVAMWFNSDLDDLYTSGIVPAIQDCGFKALRIDAKETNSKICDEIIAEIRRSRFVIADFTGSRGGVYFEAGFAMGLGIPIIWTCRNCKEDIDALHFDTRQYAHIC